MSIGGGQFIHAPHTGDVVEISSFYDPWYASGWVGARRIL
jgi:cell wall-associated NlpC family hydrolase